MLCWICFFFYRNDTAIKETNQKSNTSNFLVEDPFFLVSDLIFNVYFLLEALIRLSVCPRKVKWLLKTFNIIQIVPTLSFFIIFIMEKSGYRSIIMIYIRYIIEFLRVLLLFKLTNISWRFKTVNKAIRKSWMEILMFLFFMTLSIFIGSTIMFYIENESNSSFSSILSVCWWSIVTMTTVIIFKKINMFIYG